MLFMSVSRTAYSLEDPPFQYKLLSMHDTYMFVEIQPDHAFLRQVVCVNAPQDVTSDLPHHDLLRRTCCEDPHTGVLIVDGGGETLIPACLSAQINEARFRFESLFIGSGHGQETVVYRHPMIPCPVMGQERKLEVVAHGARVYVWLLRGKISATSPAAEGMPCCQILPCMSGT